MNQSTHPASCRQHEIDIALLPQTLLFKDNTMNKYPADEKTLNNIQDILIDRIPTLKPNNIYRAEQLFGKNLWLSFPPSDRKLIGGIVAGLVKDKKLPLNRVSNSSSNKAQYQPC